MLTHHQCPGEPIDIRWQRPVLPDRGPTPKPVESPISRRLLRNLQIVPGDRVLEVGTRDPQFLECIADAVGARGHITCIESDPDRLDRLRRRTRRLRDVVEVLPELPPPTHDRYDAAAVVVRDRTVPDLGGLRRFTERLDAGGRLALIAFEEPVGLIASSGVFRANPALTNPPRRPTTEAVGDQSRSHLRRAS